MRKLIFFAVLSICFCLQSCQDDIIGERTVDEVISTDPTVSVTIETEVSGIITNISGEALSNVEIEYSRKIYQTDINGYFRINDIDADQQGGILKIRKEGFFDNYKVFIPGIGANSFLRVTMVDRIENQTIESSTGGTINVAGGASINFPENAFVYEGQDTSYSGSVKVFAHWYDPSNNNISQSMPGDLRGLSAEGKIVQLSTYGMMAVELETPNGNKLDLANGKFADLSFPIPSNLSSNAPELIKTWSLNEETIYWEEEDVAELVGNEVYVTKVSHFSFWNCDAPFPLVNISGKLIDVEGNPLPHFNICIEAIENSVTGYGWTNSQGDFNGKVPQDEALVFKVKDACGNSILIEEIGPFNNDASFGEIIVENSELTTITGQLLCNGDPITNGYITIKGANIPIYDIVETDENGFFEAHLFVCADGSIDIQGYDLSDFKSSEIITIDVGTNRNIQLPPLMVCDELEEYVRYKINGSSEKLFRETERHGLLTNGRFVIEAYDYGVDSSFFSILITDTQIGTNSMIQRLDAFLNNGNSNERFSCDMNCDNLELEIKELGEYISGEFMGEIDGETIMASFRLKNEVPFDELECSYEVEDASECLNTPGSIYMEIFGGAPPYSVGMDGLTLTTITDNEFTWTGLGPGTYSIIVIDGNQETCEAELTVENVSSNIECELIISPTNCDANNGALEAEVVGGSGDYTYDWSNGEVGPSIANLSTGTYMVTITDELTGCTTICDGFVYPNDSLFVEIIFPDVDICSGTETFFLAEVIGGNGPFEYLWNDGETDAERLNLSEGIYTVTVTDVNGCTAEQTIQVEFLENIYDIEFNFNHTSCNGNGLPIGTIEAFAPDILNPLEIEWDNGFTGAAIDAEYGETYTVTIYDDFGCYGTETVEFLPADTRLIRGFAWLDNDGGDPNVYDLNIDSLLQGITVRLYDTNDLNNILEERMTGLEGEYSFLIEEEGEYILQFLDTGVVGFEPVTMNVGINDEIDSDIDGDGFTENIEHDACFGITNICAGFL